MRNVKEDKEDALHRYIPEPMWKNQNHGIALKHRPLPDVFDLLMAAKALKATMQGLFAWLPFTVIEPKIY